MGLNLHGIVRDAINQVNPDALGTYRRSTGSTTNAAGKRAPDFEDFPETRFQVQALSWKDLQHKDMQNVQGIARAVYMFGNPLGVARPDVRGGDLLVFPQVPGAPPQTWKVCAVFESWGPDSTAWARVGAVLQRDSLGS